MIPMDVYGRTPEWYRKMYQADRNPDVSPTIAIIALNNNYNLEDLRSYWTHVCGLSTMPTVIDVLVGHTVTQRNTGFGVAYHNTLQLEIVGALCPKATILFISAPNTSTGLYQAMSSAIYGTKVNGVRYQANIVLCAWGTSERTLKPVVLNAFNNLFERASERKIAIIASAGDNGYDHKEVNFPASSPHVISVGGTTLLASGKETTWRWNDTFQWGTRSGSSKYFSTTTNEKRRVPDLSLNADPNHGYTIFVDDKLILNGIGGTGCASALCAGFLASMDDIPN
jgi:kumamolisin